MLVMPSDDDGESADSGRPCQEGAGGRFDPSFPNALLIGSEAVHMVGLIGSAAGVEEAAEGGNEKCGFVVADGKRACEEGAGLSLSHGAVGEEDRILCGKRTGQFGSLSDKASWEDDKVSNAAPFAEDKVIGDYPRADKSGVGGVAADGSVFKPERSVEDGGRTDTDIANESAVKDACFCTDPSVWGFCFLDGIVD